MQRYCYLLLATLIVFSAAAAHADLEDGIVFYFTFDNVKGKKVIDESKNGHDADVIANTKFSKGHIGDAIEITAEGADCVNIPAADDLKIEGEITMMAWVYQDAWAATSAQWFDKNCHNGGEKNSYGIGVFGPNILMMLGEGGSRRNHEVPNAMDDKKWHHIVGTYDGSTMKIFLDGKLLGEKGEKFDFAGTNDQDVRLGCAKDRPQYSFDKGLIDEAALWSRALDLNEIKTAMEGDLLAVYPEDKLATTWGSVKRRGL
jgi:hypothetical protein